MEDLRAEPMVRRHVRVVSVQDAGAWIAPDQLIWIFTRFAHGPASGHLSLGLYLAQGIAAAHGGTLTVESVLGQGTTFHLALPLHPA